MMPTLPPELDPMPNFIACGKYEDYAVTYENADHICGVVFLTFLAIGALYLATDSVKSLVNRALAPLKDRANFVIPAICIVAVVIIGTMCKDVHEKIREMNDNQVDVISKYIAYAMIVEYLET